jgi:hypothetical protein
MVYYASMSGVKLCRLLAILVVCSLCGCSEQSVGPQPPPPEGPDVVIYKPPAVTGSGGYSKVIVFGWRSSTDDDPAYVRYLWSLIVDTTGTYSPSFDMIGDMNKNPWRYEDRWTPWIPYDAPGDSGRTTTIGDDETVQLGRSYVFAVQAKDRLGRITSKLDVSTNARRFQVKVPTGPTLNIYEQYLAGFRFIGTSLSPESRDMPPGIPLHFRWLGDASYYGGEMAGYRYAWDIVDLGAWDAPFQSDLTDAGEVKFFAGVHTLFIEAIDKAGYHVLARITVNVIPWPMDRNLLFVDDYAASSLPLSNYANPSESQHDNFWLGICSRAEGFDPTRDVYDCVQNQLLPPGPALIGRYKNIVWEYSSSNNAWGTVIRFVSESDVGKGRLPINYLACFILKGGHLWTLGRSERAGGLAAMLSATAQSFPVNLQCELLGNRSSCGLDRSGVTCFAYRDYCVTMLDKVDGVFRQDADMPHRRVQQYDCMRRAYRDNADPLTAAHHGLPKGLDLWEEVTKPGRYFDPYDTLGPGGFTYVEVYDPTYWMKRNSLQSQPCFHPMYRMIAADVHSVLNGGTIAIWVSNYDTVVPDVSAGIAVAAPSMHFGFPLWFFKRSEVDSIVTVVFDEWRILKVQ